MRTGKLRVTSGDRNPWFRDIPIRQPDPGPIEYLVGVSPLSPDGWAPLPEHHLPSVRWDDETGVVNVKKAVVNAYQTTPAGRLVLHLEDDQGECAELIISAGDVERVMCACIAALQKKASTR